MNKIEFKNNFIENGEINKSLLFLVIKTIEYHKDILCDDLFIFDIDFITKYILNNYINTYAVYHNDIYVGFIIAFDFVINKVTGIPYSCMINGAINKGISPNITREVFKKFLKNIYESGIVQVKACCEINNYPCSKLLEELGFVYCGRFKGEGLRNNKIIDKLYYSRLNDITLGKDQIVFRQNCDRRFSRLPVTYRNFKYKNKQDRNK